MTQVECFGFGAAAPGQSYPSIYIVGWVNNVYGIWQSSDDAKTWTQIGTYPDNSVDQIKTISGDPGIYGQVYVGFQGSGYAYLPAAGTPPPPPPPAPPPAPSILSFTPDVNGVDNTSSINLTGTAEAGSSVTVYDGSSNLGSTPVDTSGNWPFSESNAANGVHTFTATDTDANGTSVASSPFAVTVSVPSLPPPPPPQPPPPPVISSFTPDSSGVDRTHIINLAGSAEAGSTVTVFDGTLNLGQTVADMSGSWVFTESNAANGTHVFTATDTDANGTSAASAAFDVTVHAHHLIQAIASTTPMTSTSTATPTPTTTTTPLQLAPPLT